MAAIADAGDGPGQSGTNEVPNGALATLEVPDNLALQDQKSWGGSA